MYFRPNTTDAAIFNSVFNHNEYKINTFKDTDVIVDIGAHIGSFSLLAWEKSCRNIYAYEANIDNFSILKKNTENTNIHCYHNAVRGNYSSLTLGSVLPPTMPNTGGIAVLKKGDVPVKTLNDILAEVGGTIDFVKLDCEGSEYSIIFESDPAIFEHINTIVGEFHAGTLPVNLCEGFDNTPENLEAYLIKAGYNCSFSYYPNSSMGKFFCTKITL